MLQNAINILLIYYENLYTMIFLKIFNIIGNLKKKCGYLDLLYRQIAKVGAKVGVKVLLATSLTGLLPWLPKKHTFKDNKKCNKVYE